MATKQFALPLDKSSKQSGDITFEELVDNGQKVTFRLTNVSSGMTNQLNLITSKGGTPENHIYSATIASGTATVEVSVAEMTKIFNAADGGDWDYVEANWMVGAVDTPMPSNLFEIQGGNTYDGHGWPPA